MELEGRQNAPSPKKDYSDQLKEIIQNVSASQRFQMRLIVFLLLVGFLSNIQLNSSHVMYMNPAFHCQGEKEKVSEVKACKRIQSCQIINGETLTAHLNLYCGGRADDRVFIQSAVGIGNWAGIIFTTLISDHFGRRFCFCFAVFMLSIGCILQFIGATKDISILLAASQVIYGFSGKSLYVNFLLLSTRFLKKRRYEFATIAWFIIGTGITNIIIAILNEYFASWRLLFYIYFTGFILASVASLFVVKEDPIYYFDTERYQQCKEVVTSVSYQNGTDAAVLEDNLKKIEAFVEAKAHGQLYHSKKLSQFNLREVLRCDILTGVVVLGAIGLFYSMAGTSIDYSMQGLKLSYNYNLFITGCSNIIGYITSVYIILAEEHRMKGLLISSAIYGVAAMLFIFDYCVNNPVIETILIVTLKITLCWIGGFYVRLKVDLFPERYQGTLVGVIEFIAGFGKTLGPKFVQISSNHSINPIFSVNVLRLTLGTLPVFLLSEKKIDLAQLEHHEAKEEAKEASKEGKEHAGKADN